MDILKRHEIFEIEVLEALKNNKFLEPLVFGGGTMLRLCYGLKRYSTDLDFWFVKRTEPKRYFEKMKRYLQKSYELTDAQIKFYTILFELRSAKYPKRLKIEIRKAVTKCDFQDRIAYSKYDNRQVIMKVFTPEEAMRRKIAAALDRKDVRDCFDMEFLARKGVRLDVTTAEKRRLNEVIDGFKDTDYKVTLGSVLEPDMRKYYVKNGFDYLSRLLI